MDNTGGEYGTSSSVSSSRYTLDTIRLSCVHTNTSQSNSMVGYTGHQSNTKEVSDPIVIEKVPTLGYGGWYRGRNEGKIGRIGLHKGPLSQWDMEHSVKRESNLNAKEVDCSSRYDRTRVIGYENSLEEARSRGQQLSRIIRDIKNKLDFKFRNVAEKRAKFKTIFSIYDRLGSGLCSDTDFQSALIQLSIILPGPEFRSLCSEFDEFSSGDISYLKFFELVD